MNRDSSSKSKFFLMEFICVVLFFSICTAICLGAFVKADRISKESSQLNEGLLLAQSTAEYIKDVEGKPDISRISAELEALQPEAYEDYGVTLETQMKETMLTVDIFVYSKEETEKEICRLEVKKYLPKEGSSL